MIQKKLFEMSWSNLLIKLGIACSVLVLITSCGNDDDEDLVGNWVELGSFEGDPVSDAIGVTLGDKAYVGTGYDGEDRRVDFWEYDPASDYWQQKADFIGGGRNGAVAFSAAGKVYVGTGYDGTYKLNDFYAYDPGTNEWTQINDFGGSARYGAIAMTIGDKGYVGTGYDGGYQKDFWEFDPATGNWTQKVSIAVKRMDAMSFVIDGYGYVCGGLNNGTYEDDFSRYNPETDSWEELRDISDASDDDYDDDYSIRRTNGVTFVMDGKGYVATGGRSTTGGDVWEYNPNTDLWVEKTELIEDGEGGSDRTEAVGFSINGIGYITTGRNSSYYFDDVWRFEPNAEMDEDD